MRRSQLSSFRVSRYVAMTVTLCLILVGLTSTGTANASQQGLKSCGKLDRGTWVGARNVKCAKGKRVLRYWLNYGPGVKWHRRGDTYTLRRFPGWKCGSGAGGGACFKARKRVEYNTFGPYSRLATRTTYPGRYCGRAPLRKSAQLRASYITCRKARRVIKYWFKGGPGVVLHTGNFRSYYTLRRYPIWTCADGAGGGSCKRGRKYAFYFDRMG